jgi:hypothetical protein
MSTSPLMSTKKKKKSTKGGGRRRHQHSRHSSHSSLHPSRFPAQRPISTQPPAPPSPPLLSFPFLSSFLFSFPSAFPFPSRYCILFPFPPPESLFPFPRHFPVPAHCPFPFPWPSVLFFFPFSYLSLFLSCFLPYLHYYYYCPSYFLHLFPLSFSLTFCPSSPSPSYPLLCHSRHQPSALRPPAQTKD